MARSLRRRLIAGMSVAVVVAAGCGSSSDGGEGTGATDGPSTSAPTTTTADPFDQTVLDDCGNDLSSLTSTVWGVDPQDGTVRWRTAVPLAESFLLRDASGDPRLSLVRRPVEAVIDGATGEVVETPAAGAHEVLVDVSGATDSGVGGLLVDGEAQPATIDVGALRVTTAAGETGQTTVGLTATDAATAAPAWRVELGPTDSIGSLSPPVVFGDTVVVVSSQPRPACPS